MPNCLVLHCLKLCNYLKYQFILFLFFSSIFLQNDRTNYQISTTLRDFIFWQYHCVILKYVKAFFEKRVIYSHFHWWFLPPIISRSGSRITADFKGFLHLPHFEYGLLLISHTYFVIWLLNLILSKWTKPFEIHSCALECCLYGIFGFRKMRT